MINSLTGKITGKHQGCILFQCGPIEWSLLVSDTTRSSLPGVGTECLVFTYMHHREDQFFLVGFSDELERQLFLDLISVSGIGPKQGLKILSGISSTLLTEAIRHDDITALSKVPGLGKKTAQKVILSLKGKLVEPPSAEQPQDETDMIEALVQMGYDRQQVKKAVRELTANIDFTGMDTSQREVRIMKEAIRLLS